MANAVITYDPKAQAQGLLSLLGDIPTEGPAWLKASREQGQKAFSELGLPTKKNESWKYTKLKPFFENASLSKGKAVAVSEAELADYRIAGAIEAVFVNGIFSEELSLITQNRDLQLRPVLDALEDEAFRDFITEPLEVAQDAFCQLNRAQFEQGVFIHSQKCVATPVHILHVNKAAGKNAIALTRNYVHLEKSSNLVLTESYISLDDSANLSVPVTNIKIDKSAHLRYARIQSESLNACHIGTTTVKLDRGAQIESCAIAAGGKIARHIIDVELNGEAAEAHLDGLALSKGSMLSNNRSVLNHNHADTVSRQLYKGVLGDKSHGVFNGRVFIAKDAQLVDSAQMSRTLLLDKRAHIDTKPEMDVYADDVKAAHGAAIGQLNDTELFYLQSRAISKDQAVKILTEGFMGEIINKLPQCIGEASKTRLAEFFVEPSAGNAGVSPAQSEASNNELSESK